MTETFTQDRLQPLAAWKIEAMEDAAAEERIRQLAFAVAGDEHDGTCRGAAGK